MRRLAAHLAIVAALACAGRAFADPATVCAPFKATWTQGAAAGIPPLCQAYFAKTAPHRAPETHKPPPKRTPRPPHPVTPAAVPVAPPPPSPPAASPTSGVWVGAFPTAALPFGGGEFCQYTETVSQAHFSVTIRTAGQATAALQFLAVESATASCPYGTLPAQTHSYYGAGGREADGSVSINIQPDPGNQPHAAGSFTGKIGPDGRLTGILMIRRDQQKPVLDWVLQVPVTLTPSP